VVYGTHFSHEGLLEYEDMEKAVSRNGYHVAYDGLDISL
jgi:hypothetical protein